MVRFRASAGNSNKTVSTSWSFTGDRWFESISLQRGVRSEPDSLEDQRKPGKAPIAGGKNPADPRRPAVSTDRRPCIEADGVVPEELALPLRVHHPVQHERDRLWKVAFAMRIVRRIHQAQSWPVRASRGHPRVADLAGRVVYFCQSQCGAGAPLDLRKMLSLMSARPIPSSTGPGYGTDCFGSLHWGQTSERKWRQGSGPAG
jgi:hypothetical protein